jgi:hypothetical protein
MTSFPVPAFRVHACVAVSCKQDGASAVFVAALGGHLGAAEAILRAGGDVNRATTVCTLSVMLIFSPTIAKGVCTVDLQSSVGGGVSWR